MVSPATRSSPQSSETLDPRCNAQPHATHYRDAQRRARRHVCRWYSAGGPSSLLKRNPAQSGPCMRIAASTRPGTPGRASSAARAGGGCRPRVPLGARLSLANAPSQKPPISRLPIAARPLPAGLLVCLLGPRVSGRPHARRRRTGGNLVIRPRLQFRGSAQPVPRPNANRAPREEKKTPLPLRTRSAHQRHPPLQLRPTARATCAKIAQKTQPYHEPMDPLDAILTRIAHAHATAQPATAYPTYLS
jgi:hypothetical protein